MRRITRWFHYLIGAGAGAGLAYLFDPDRGRSRRARLTDQTAAAARQARGRLEERARYSSGKAQGAVARATGHGTPEPADDRATVELVRQSLSRLPFATTSVTVEVVDGWATLRGELASRDQILQTVAAVRETPGVRDVGSYLHLPGEPAPNKEDALRAS